MEYLLLALVCPVAMGLMMWMMMRGNRSAPSSGPDPEVARLRAELDELRQTRQASGEQDPHPGYSR
ncbi:MAG: hypothetical protein ACRDQ7_04750 [Haloechinothrix sp.]